jgi:predicted secreted protein
MKKTFFFILLSALLAGCGAKPTPPTVPTLVFSDPGKTLEVTAGTEFKIIINSNPTTGYHWELVGELDENLVQFISKDYRPDEPILTGSGGMDVWAFKAVAPGETTIVLGNYPPGEGEPAIQEVTFTVVIK